MKVWIVAVLFAMGCSKDKAPAASTAEEARPTVTDPLGFCERARRVMMGRRKCFAEDTSLKMALDGIAKLVGGAPSDPEPRRKVAAECAVMLDGLLRVQQPKDCPLDVTDSERAELVAFLDAWYGERTAPPKTDNADADAAVAKIAAKRDTACACKDTTCARAAGTEIQTDLDALASDAPKADRDAATKMLDEAVRCRQKLAFAPPK